MLEPNSPAPAWRPLARVSRIPVAAVAALLLSACAGATAGIPVFAAAGTRQCEPSAADPRDAALARLQRAGIAATAPRCGHDGRMRPALCGLPDGRIVIVDVAPSALDAARAAGWAPLSDAPDAAEQPCR